jgi:DNA-binding FadR family transcriptional regulator
VSSRVPFAPVARQTLTDQVRDQLQERILAGTFPAGSLLPSEGTLCQELGVSRPSVREAIRELMVLGLVERRGNRACVVEQLPEVRFDVAERLERVRELFETRRAIEVPLTQYAAERATQAQREQLCRLASALSDVTRLEQLRPHDEAFHSLIAASAGNDLLAGLHNKVLDALFNSPKFEDLMSEDLTLDEELNIVKSSARSHKAIAKAVLNADPNAAANAARQHLDDVERRLLERSRRAKAPS